MNNPTTTKQPTSEPSACAGPDSSRSTGSSLGDALPNEIERVQNLIPIYESIGPAGGFAIAMMKRDLMAASEAMIGGDLVGMLRAYESLKGYKE